MPKSDKLQLCLIVEMEIAPNGVDEKLIKDQILSVVAHAVDGGIITGTTAAELLNHKAYVSKFTKDFREIPEKTEEKEAVA